MNSNRNWLVTTIIGTLFISIIGTTSPARATNRRGWSISAGAFLSPKDKGRSLSTGADQKGTALNYGLEFGAHYQLRMRHTLGIWTSVGIGESSWFHISYFGGGFDYIFGNKVDGFAIGPTVGLTSEGMLAGVVLFFRNIYARAGYTFTRTVSDSEAWGAHFSLGYSFYLGR